MFGFACARCWDRNCSCTEEELRQDRLTENNTSLEKTKSEPHVMRGDIVFKNDVEYIVKRVVDGIGVVSRVTNIADEMEFEVRLEPPYSLPPPHQFYGGFLVNFPNEVIIPNDYL